MKQSFKFLLAAIIMAALWTTAGAQRYVVDNLFGDSVRVDRIVFNDDKTAELPGETAFYLQPGDTVTVTRILKGNSYPAITVKGKSGEFTITQQNLKFCDNNPDIAVDQWADKKWNENRGLKKFFATFTPYAIIAILFVVAIVILFLGLKVTLLRKPALYVVPVCLLIASLMEILAYWLVGTDAFWWCNPDKYGFFGSLFRVIPFVAFVAFQLFSIKLYMRLLTNDKENELSVKPMLISIGLCVPVTLAVTFSCAGFLGVRDTPLVIITVVTFLLTLGIGLFISTKKNTKELGKVSGMMFSLFGIVWAIGAIVALIGLIMVIFKLIIQIIVVIAAFFGLAFAMGSGGGGNSGGGNVMWYDANGHSHTNEIDAKAANERIAEEKANS